MYQFLHYFCPFETQLGEALKITSDDHVFYSQLILSSPSPLSISLIPVSQLK